MKHHACIAIGINQYQYLQPLSYAQEDAEALHSFLVGEADFSPEGCLLLTDNSPLMWGQSTRPTRENILKLTESLCREHLPHGDLLWCFFSGYGVNYSGEDYLMPIDGNPADVAATGIPVRSLFESLKGAPTETVVVLLDMNRSQGAKAGETVGAFTEELARQMEIPTLLSCRPNQVSRETSALRHGFFTAALLEGLRSGECSTLKGLERYLGNRLPELSEHHLRPRQDATLVVFPPGKSHQVILPDSFHAAIAVSGVGRNGAVATAEAPTQTLNQTQVGAATAQLEPGAPAERDTTVDSAREATQPTPTNSVSSKPMEQDNSNSETPGNADQEAVSDRSFLQQLILWSGATALVLLMGVFVANRSVFVGNGGADPKQPQTAQKAAPPGSSQSQAKVPVAGSAPSQPLTVPQPVSSKPNSGGEALASTQGVLDRAKVLLKDSSASSFSDAIAQVRKIPANDPLFPEAQTNIERWSQTMLDIANGRAGQQNFQGAIAAAKLVPNANESIYQQAQKAIAYWQDISKQQGNATTLAAAKKQIQRGVASSYNKAIEQASKIKPDQVSYKEAQKLISEWSGVILNIAQLRASQGRLADAIEAGELVPKGTDVYAPAQKSMAEWKRKLQSQKKS